MTALTSDPLASLPDRLFAEAEGPASPRLRSALAQAPADRRAAMGAGPTDYREFYAQAQDDYLAVSRETGRLLYLLTRSSGARTVVEFGTSFGISTLHLAAGLRDNGGGRLITSEFEPSKVGRARENFAAAGLEDLIELREGDALQTLAHDLPETIDLVLLDGAKGLYPGVLALLEPHLPAGALIIADDAERSPEYLQRVRSADDGFTSMPFGGDVEVSLRG
jgi:predicted O-methyltransferase YrrM